MHCCCCAWSCYCYIGLALVQLLSLLVELLLPLGPLSTANVLSIVWALAVNKTGPAKVLTAELLLIQRLLLADLLHGLQLLLCLLLLLLMGLLLLLTGLLLLLTWLLMLLVGLLSLVRKL